eukprot:TRINITY_DN18146_c0_g1_i1.p1 TRINITY_DN18146_c0_g1~~TRINITY_DN18146_c0_g1_i1.p1  ORF type:complete len:660 (+),score=43.55 TRINITY_DN18146_c0_g1_i1:77-1981(+)
MDEEPASAAAAPAAVCGSDDGTEPATGCSPHPKRRRKEPDKGKTAHPLIVSALEALCKASELRVSGPQTGYRNKITYSISDKFEPTPLAAGPCNDVCAAVFEWAAKRTAVALSVWHEVCVKVSRDGRILLKLTFVCSAEQARSWKATEAESFVSWITAVQPAVETVVYQSNDSTAKPGKGSEYVVIHGTGYLSERTPNNVRYRISADSFCEINHHMEDRLWALMLGWLCWGEEEWDLMLLGRDSNPLACGLYPALRVLSKCRSAFCINHCPRVTADLVHNVKENCVSSMHATVTGVTDKFEYAAAISRSGLERGVRVVMNAGRSGMAAATAAALTAHPNIQQIICFSCNPRTLAPDATKMAAGGFCVSHYRSIDFFPGTQYVMQAVCFQRPYRRLLLPVGPPGSGKSTLCRTLAAACVGSELIERDLVFAHCRSEQPSFAKTRLCSKLKCGGDEKSWTLYDSTNGDASGRKWAVSEWLPAAGVRRGCVVVCALRAEGVKEDVEKALVDRCAARRGHPAFPSDRDGAVKKVQTVAQSIEWPSMVPGEELSGHDHFVVEVDALRCAEDRVARAAFASLWLSPQLASAALSALSVRNTAPHCAEAARVTEDEACVGNALRKLTEAERMEADARAQCD